MYKYIMFNKVVDSPLLTLHTLSSTQYHSLWMSVACPGKDFQKCGEIITKQAERRELRMLSSEFRVFFNITKKSIH
jgi:hypothetical protein